ncbi:MAG: hypothetical protein LBL30_00590 [Holosporales bacterium]|jgi:hypothetical protein|nr:hypothetical protein [Holosporales bacterium]
MQKFLYYIVALCLFRETALATIERPDFSNPTTSTALENLSEHMRSSLIKYCGDIPISEMHKFGQGTTSVYKVSLADGRIFVMKDSRKSEVANNRVALEKLEGRGNEPLCLEGKAEPWGRFVTITHCFLNGEWQEVNDPKVPSLLDEYIDYSFLQEDRQRNGTPIPTIQPFFSGIGDLSLLPHEKQVMAMNHLAEAVVFAEQFGIALGDLHLDNYLYGINGDIAFIDLDPHGSYTIPYCLISPLISPRCGALTDLEMVCHLLRSLLDCSEAHSPIYTKTLEFIEQGWQVSPYFLNHFFNEAWREVGFAGTISACFTKFEGHLANTLTEQGLLFNIFAFERHPTNTFTEQRLLLDIFARAAASAQPNQLASNYMESCLFDIMKVCKFGTGKVSYGGAVLLCVPRYFGNEFAQFVADVSPLHFALWVNFMMNEMDTGRKGYDMDFIELTWRYMLRDQIHMGVFGRHIGNRAKEWQKMTKGPDNRRYGVMVGEDLY